MTERDCIVHTVEKENLIVIVGIYANDCIKEPIIFVGESYEEIFRSYVLKSYDLLEEEIKAYQIISRNMDKEEILEWIENSRIRIHEFVSEFNKLYLDVFNSLDKS